MATTATDTVRGYTVDLIAVLDHCADAIKRQMNEDQLTRIAGAGPALRQVHQTLCRQRDALQRRAESMGGGGMTEALKDAMTAVSGFFAGLWGKVRPETASRMLRDDYAALAFVSVCTQMLHTTALTVRDIGTAQLTLQHLNELPPLQMAVNELVPAAVVADLGIDGVPIEDPNAAEAANENWRDAWRHASVPVA